MKIREAEELILREGLTDELLAEYEKALRRSGSDYHRQQNCYILGYNLRERDYLGALRLVEYAMQRYRFTFPGDRRRGYEMLAHIHRDNGRADLAKQYLQVTRELLRQEQRGEPQMGETLELLRNELTLTAYRWSEDLERLYLDTDPEADLIWTLRPNALLLAMAEYLVAEHRQDEAFMAHARAWMERLLFDAEKTEADRLWERHQVDMTILLTPAQEDFLCRIGILK